MNPIKFKEQNFTFKAPDNMDNCVDLPVFRDDQQSISKWKMTPEEIEHVVKHGFIWIRVFGAGHPPILPQACETVFETVDPNAKLDEQMDRIMKEGTDG